MGLQAVRLLRSLLVALLCLAPTASQPFWQSRDSNYNVNIVSGGGSSATYTPIYGDSQQFSFGAGPYTSPSQTWTAGVAVVSVWSDSQNTDLAVTIKGVSATQIGGYSGTGHRCSAWRATVTSGSGTVVVSSAGTFDSLATVGGVVTTATPVPAGFQISDMAIVAEPQSAVTVSIPTSGVGVFFASGAFGTAATLPLTWTGATRDAVTETFTGSSATAASSASGGAHATAAGSTNPSVSSANSTFNFTGSSGCMTAAAWSP